MVVTVFSPVYFEITVSPHQLLVFLELYDCSLSHAFVFSNLFYSHHLYNGTLLSVTETVVCLSQCGGLRGAVC